mgnify:CR=1 FL=1
MNRLPNSDDSPVVRTDFSDQAAWVAVCEAVRTPVREGPDEFVAYVDFIDDPSFEGLTPESLRSVIDEGCDPRIVFLVDRVTLAHPDHPILVVDLDKKESGPFRVIPSLVWSVESNLSIGNMDYEEFAGAVGPDGVFRGF